MATARNVTTASRITFQTPGGRVKVVRHGPKDFGLYLDGRYIQSYEQSFEAEHEGGVWLHEQADREACMPAPASSVTSISITHQAHEDVYHVRLNGRVVAYAATPSDALREAQIELAYVQPRDVPVTVSYGCSYILRWDGDRAACSVTRLSSVVTTIRSLSGKTRRAFPVFRYYPVD